MPTGLFNTSLFTTDSARKSFAAMITRLMPNGAAPLFGLTSMLPDHTALQFQHGYFTKTMLFPNIVCSGAGQLIGDTTFIVVSSANIVPGQLLRSQTTGEIVSVSSVTDATHIVVVRAIGTIAATAVAASQVFYVVGNGYEEGSTRPTALWIQPALVNNYTHIFRNAWQISKTVAATQMAIGDTNIAENRRDCAAFHAADIEKALFFSQKFLGTRNGQPFHLMDGLVNVITTLAAGNITTLGGTTNYTQFEAAVDPVFNQTTDPKVANERILFVGGSAKKVINNIGRLNGTYMMVDGQTEWGLQFQTIRTARGAFRIIEHPLFNSNVDWQKMGVVVDLTTFALPYLMGRKTVSEDYNQDGELVDSGIDAVGGSLTSELTTEIRNPSANAVLNNFTAAAVG